MPKFRQDIKVIFTVNVEAEDVYVADDVISRMRLEDVINASTGRPYVDTDTDELPEEVG